MLKIKLFVFLCFINFNCFSQSLAEYINSAVYNEVIGENEASIRAWDNAIKIDTSDCGWLYFMRAKVKWRLGDINGEIKDYLYAIDRNLDCDFLNDSEADYGWGKGVYISPGSKRDLLFTVAKEQSKIEDYSNAMVNFTKVINNKFGYVDLGAVYFERGKLKSTLLDYKSAISDFNLALKYNPRLPVYYFRGNAMFNLKNYLGAINDYTIIIQSNPNDSPNAYFNRGLARIYFKQIQLGCKDLSKAGEQGNLDAYEVIKEHCKD
jgi:tetratricopeptide (TPR) repeat protein